MTTINLDDDLINQVIAKSHYQNAQEAVSKILSDYLQQPKQANIIDLLAMPEVAELEFNPPKLNTPLFHPAEITL